MGRNLPDQYPRVSSRKHWFGVFLMDTFSGSGDSRPSPNPTDHPPSGNPGSSTPNGDLRKKLLLALGSLGIVYGDIGTSPLYAVKECFHGPHAIALTRPILWASCP